MSILCTLIQVYVLVIIARILASWFPVRPETPIGQVVGVLVTVTEPVLAPARRVIPPIGMFDVSTLVVIFALQLLQRSICY